MASSVGGTSTVFTNEMRGAAGWPCTDELWVAVAVLPAPSSRVAVSSTVTVPPDRGGSTDANVRVAVPDVFTVPERQVIGVLTGVPSGTSAVPELIDSSEIGLFAVVTSVIVAVGFVAADTETGADADAVESPGTATPVSASVYVAVATSETEVVPAGAAPEWLRTSTPADRAGTDTTGPVVVLTTCPLALTTSVIRTWTTRLEGLVAKTCEVHVTSPVTGVRSHRIVVVKAPVRSSAHVSTPTVAGTLVLLNVHR